MPEIEAIATDELVRIEAEGLARVIPTARAAHITMNRERIRRLAAEELGLPTSPYAFASSLEEMQQGIERHRLSLLREAGDVLVGQRAESRSRRRRGSAGLGVRAVAAAGCKQPRVIVEGEIRFDFEITLLTVRARGRHVISASPSATCRWTAITSRAGSRRR